MLKTPFQDVMYSIQKVSAFLFSHDLGLQDIKSSNHSSKQLASIVDAWVHSK